MCLLFHKWSKWGPVRKESWSRFVYITGRIFQTTKSVQDRICEKCGKIEKRYLGTEEEG
jgi:hypothetical protein